MGTTPIYAIPYVDPGSTVATFPASDQAQAEAVENVLKTLPVSCFTACRLTSDQSIANNAITTVNLSAEVNEGAAFTMAAGVLTTVKPGVYVISASLYFAPNTTGMRMGYLSFNGATRQRVSTPGAAVGDTLNLARTARLNVGTTIALQAYQNSGAPLVLDSSNYQCLLDIARVAI